MKQGNLEPVIDTAEPYLPGLVARRDVLKFNLRPEDSLEHAKVHFFHVKEA